MDLTDQRVVGLLVEDEETYKKKVVKTKVVQYELFNEYFYLCNNSPSGLRWKKKRPFGMMKVGDVAGNYYGKTNKYWLVGFDKKYYKVHRIIIALHLKRDIDETFNILHKNNVSYDNSIENLLVSVVGDTKPCMGCGEIKLSHNFSKNSSLKDGLSMYCSSCFGNSKDEDKYNIDFSDILTYSKDSPTRLTWSKDVVCSSGKRTKNFAGGVAGTLKTKSVVIRCEKYSIPKIILSLFSVAFDDTKHIKYINEDCFDFSIENLQVEDKKNVKIRERKKKYHQRVRNNSDTIYERRMLRSAKERATRSNIPFDISAEDIQIPSHCPILGIPISPSKEKVSPNSPSLDRKNPALGYVKGNVWVISYKANTMKNDANKETLVSFAEWVLNEHK